MARAIKVSPQALDGTAEQESVDSARTGRQPSGALHDAYILK